VPRYRVNASAEVHLSNARGAVHEVEIAAFVGRYIVAGIDLSRRRQPPVTAESTKARPRHRVNVPARIHLPDARSAVDEINVSATIDADAIGGVDHRGEGRTSVSDETSRPVPRHRVDCSTWKIPRLRIAEEGTCLDSRQAAL